MVIAIDGIAASGKSTIGKRLAKQLGFRFLDSGVLYRLITIQYIEHYTNKAEEAEQFFSDEVNTKTFITTLLVNLQVSIEHREEYEAILVSGKNYATMLHAPDVNSLVPIVAASPSIREFVRHMQKDIVNGNDVVVVGRDIGTVVFPDAPYKFFITVDERIRAMRRLLQLGNAKPNAEQIDSTITSLRTRDDKDRERAHSPLTKTAETITIDNSSQTIDEIVEHMYHIVHGK